MIGFLLSVLIHVLSTIYRSLQGRAFAAFLYSSWLQYFMCVPNLLSLLSTCALVFYVFLSDSTYTFLFYFRNFSAVYQEVDLKSETANLLIIYFITSHFNLFLPRICE